MVSGYLRSAQTVRGLSRRNTLRKRGDGDAAQTEGYGCRPAQKTGRPIFRTIFNAMMLVTLVEVVLLAVSIAITNVDGRLN